MKKIALATNIFFIFLLLVTSSFPGQAAKASGTPSLPILFGSYTTVDLQNSISELTSMDNWLTSNGASGVSLAGDFVGITFNPFWNVPHELDAAWNNGFVPFINLMPSETWEGSYYDSNCDTAADIAGGLCDAKLTTWAGYFKDWASTDKRAFIAPLPEMNGDWTVYASDGPTFIQAFIRIRTLFESAGVPRSAVRWVFAPNGWNNPGYPWKQFEYFYPGDAYTDIVSFSGYNYGGCPTHDAIWDRFETAMKPYLDRIHAMAPSKPIFISQTGVLNVPLDGSDTSQTKSAWIQDTFSKLADYPAVRAILYFNKINASEVVGNCAAPDYRIYYGSSNGEAGFLSIMKDSRFGQWDAKNANWSRVAFADPAYTFIDVQPTHPFSGAPNAWYYTDVHKLYNNGITGGCTTNPLKYCPNDTITRAQMAVFLEKGMNGSAYSPPPAQGNVFGDVPLNYWAAAWVEQLALDGITGGCGGGNYCPDNAVTRAQMAIFLLKAEHGPAFSPPAATGVFTDVPVSYWAAAWIEQLAVEGITGGCGSGIYCPDSSVTRAQMAVFLVKTFNLP